MSHGKLHRLLEKAYNLLSINTIQLCLLDRDLLVACKQTSPHIPFRLVAQSLESIESYPVQNGRCSHCRRARILSLTSATAGVGQNLSKMHGLPVP